MGSLRPGTSARRSEHVPDDHLGVVFDEASRYAGSGEYDSRCLSDRDPLVWQAPCPGGLLSGG